MAASEKNKGKKARSTTKSWKRNRPEELELPSGEVALIKRPGLEEFLVEGLLPDSLTPIAQQAVNSGKGLPPAKMKNLAEDPKMVKDMIATMDRVTAFCVVDPPLLYHRRPVGEKEWEDIPQDERDENVIYTDDVQFDDKMFIFNFTVGGTRDLATFRREAGQSLASVQSG